MHEVLVNRLGGLSLPRKSVVMLTDRPDMTLDVYRGRKTTIQQQQGYCHHHMTKLLVKVCYGNIADDQYGISHNIILESNRIPEKIFCNQIMK